MSAEDARERLWRLGKRERKLKAQATALAVERREAITVARECGVTHTEIARLLGRGRTSLYKDLRRETDR